MTPKEQKVIEEVAQRFESVYGLNSVLADKLRALLPQEPERIGGLTIPEWQMLLDNNKDVLVATENGARKLYKKRYLLDIDTNNGDKCFCAYSNGTTSATRLGRSWYRNCRIIEDTQWRLNKGKQPVPDGVKVEALFRDGDKATDLAGDFDWSLIGKERRNIIAYRILGVDE